jgi:hypothetical protein
VEKAVLGLEHNVYMGPAVMVFASLGLAKTATLVMKIAANALIHAQL